MHHVNSILAAGLLAVAWGCSAADRSASRAGVPPGEDAPATRAAGDARSTPPDLVTLEVGGMTCQGCVAKVSEKIAQVPGVHSVKVDLEKQRAVVIADRAVPDSALTGAVRRAGSEFLGIVVAR